MIKELNFIRKLLKMALDYGIVSAACFIPE